MLTDERWFQGADSYLTAARDACTLPVLRKDFMVDPWQVPESRALGADAILLIMAALDDGLLAEIEASAIDCEMDVLVEVHDAKELDRAMKLKSRLIGVNNRDLRDFTVEIERTFALRDAIPDGVVVVSESGISTAAHLARLQRHGVHAALVGERLMRAEDPAAALVALRADLV